MNKFKNILTILLILVLLEGGYIIYSLHNDNEVRSSTLKNDISNQNTENNFSNTLKNNDKNNKKAISPKNDNQKNVKLDVDSPKYTYNPTGKRDPFVKYDAISKNNSNNSDSGNTPLEKLDLKQLKLTAIMSVGDNPKAVVEDNNGKGFFVEKGTKIGLNNGIISDILTDKIIITETLVDFTGQKKIRTFEMTLRK